jgi:hypothetical protein
MRRNLEPSSRSSAGPAVDPAPEEEGPRKRKRDSHELSKISAKRRYLWKGFPACQYFQDPVLKPWVMCSGSAVKIHDSTSQGCQLVYFLTKNSHFYTFSRASEWKIWVNFVAICYLEGRVIFMDICKILWSVDTFPFWYVVLRNIWQHCYE